MLGPSISAIARDWGTSRPYVRRCVHHRACPTTSLQAAREWRETCASSRAPTNPKQIARLLEEEDSDSINFLQDKSHVTRLPSLDSLRDAVDAAIEASETASRLLLEATLEGKESKIAMLLAVHGKAIEMRLKAETHYREELERRGISRDSAKALTLIPSDRVQASKIDIAISPKKQWEANALALALLDTGFL